MLSKRIKTLATVDAIMACWSTTADGQIHAAADDQSHSWRAPTLVEEVDSGSWSYDPSAPAPCFDLTAYWPSDAGGRWCSSDGS
jgi:hypothetical protein